MDWLVEYSLADIEERIAFGGVSKELFA